MAKRLHYLINKLISVLKSEISMLLVSDEESCYLEHYQLMVYKRCEHFMKQIDIIVSIEL